MPSSSRNDLPKPKIPGDRIVISGMSGLFPEAYNVKQFEEILYNKINPVTSENCRWKYDHPEVAQYTGKVPDLEHFDGQFFKVHYRLGNAMDPMSRKALEQAFQAIYDAGVNSDDLSGKKVGVYIGSCFSEAEKGNLYITTSRTGFGIMGCSKTMYANRISYWLNAKGPSIAVDQACCSSIVALELAYNSILRGDVDAAIVGGASLCLLPQSSVHLRRVLDLNKDGKTRSFDKNACGCSKSEAVNVLFLQRAKDALRVYAEIVHVKSEFSGLPEGENGPKFGFYRQPEKVKGFLKKFYEEINVAPGEVDYLEAVGSATPENDKMELDVIDDVFCKKRSRPLLVGSVLSNIGYGEAASGISSITKVILGYERGEIASNLHCDNPRDDVEGLKNGKMSIVTNHSPLKPGYAAINGLSITGVNAHVLLHGCNKPKDLNRYKSSIPHLVTISGRQQSAVEKILNDLKSRPIDPEELALFHNIHKAKISAHLGRGFTILDKNENNETISLAEKADYYDDTTSPLWFVYSGMGSQWAGMGTQLMRIPVFAAAIERCRQALGPKGLDIVHIITTPDKTIMDNILHCFVGIAAVQIGLTDVLKELGLVPDKIIGHSVGELGCAYADGCLTAEEMILSAYSRGLVSVQTPFIKGSMAAVGLGYKEVSKLIPPEIEIACHNSSESSTLSGPADKMKQFVQSLVEKGIFAKEVPCSNIAYHSKYIAEAGPGLLKYLNDVIKTPRPRSDRWVSTSIPQDRWNEELAKYSSAEYHTNNLLNSVLFEETCSLIPKNAVLVEVAPHGLLQAILKRALPSCVNIPLTRRGHSDNVVVLLEAIGKLYMEGYNPKISTLYPKVEFPVSTGTPKLGHLVEWAHTEKWFVSQYVSASKKQAVACKFLVSVHDDENKYLKGHVIRGKNLYPFSAALVSVWDTFAMHNGYEKRNVSVRFSDLHFLAQPVLHYREQLKIQVNIHRGTGKFEVLNENIVVVTGYINQHSAKENFKQHKIDIDTNESTILKANDVYKLLHTRDFNYSGDFQTIHTTSTNMTEATVHWKNNWISFIDGLLQCNALRRKDKVCCQPEFARNITIDLRHHKDILSDQDDGILPVEISDVFDRTRCGGVVIHNLRFHDVVVNSKDDIILKTTQFVPHFTTDYCNETIALNTFIQIIADNIYKDEITFMEVIDTKLSKFNNLDTIANNIVPKFKYQTKLANDIKATNKIDADVILVTNLTTNETLCKTFYKSVSPNTFIISKEYKNETKTRPDALFTVVSHHFIGDKVIKLLRWQPINSTTGTTFATVRSESDLSHLSSTLTALPKNQKLMVFSLYPPISNLVDSIINWRKANHDVNLLMINNEGNEEQQVEALPKSDLAIAALNKDIWGGYYNIPIENASQQIRDVVLESSQIGDIGSLKWVEAPQVSNSNGINVMVHYAGINETDIKRALGVVPLKDTDKIYYGMDFSGETTNGTKVMGLTNKGAARTSIKANPNLLWPVPDHWSLEDAATVPLAYCLAFYCLAIKSKLVPGMRVLIHGGSGALGQAAISICLANNCEVFTTVSDSSKKHFLKRLFPQLKETNIGNSRDVTFGDMVLGKTKGVGCDIIMSCVKGELKNISLKCCAASGLMIDTSLLKNKEKFIYGMYNMTKSRSFKVIDFSPVFEKEHEGDLKLLQLLVSEGIARGYVRPLTRVVYNPEEVSRAFRLVAASNHRGRVLINMKQKITAYKTRLSVSPDKYHVVISDEDILVIEFVGRLVEEGARKIQLICAKGSNFLMYKIKAWKELGVGVEVTVKDIWNISKISEILDDPIKAQVEGIYTIVTKKSDSAKVTKFLDNLDKNTQKGCTKLRYFAIINEESHIGQDICVSRSKSLLPAMHVTLPPLRCTDEPHKQRTISIKSAIETIERALLSPYVIITSEIPVRNTSLSKEVAVLAGVTIPETVDETTSFIDLGMDLVKSQAIRTFLGDKYYIHLDEDQVPNLTFERLQKFEDLSTEKVFYDTKGLDTFLSYADNDELLATTEMVFLPTMTNTTAMRHDEFDASQIFLCIVPGIEGHHQRFTKMCERLKLPAMVLQPKLGEPNETLEELAERLTQILLNQTDLKNFYLLGYESGVCIALEMASILESKGLTGLVYCLGGSPKEIKKQIDLQLSEYKDETCLKGAITKHLLKMMSKVDTDIVTDIFQRNTPLSEKVDNSIRKFIGKINHSAQYAKDLIEGTYTRISQVKNYRPIPKNLRSTLILIKANLSDDRVGEDSLKGFSLKPIVEYELNAPLAFTSQDLQCAAIINRHLSKDVLDDFEKRNLCETYEITCSSSTVTM
ncbi:unnamed protein product [Leptosia nina]|uniref:Uncharacterized protein n=1 Tax=Leptosia nina TaxID=320188 RepID=A0AAV1IW85_9NEOP